MNHKQPKSLNRRHFISFAAGAVVAVPMSRFLGKIFGTGILSTDEALAAGKEAPLPAGLSPVPATDPVAMALGYKPDKKDVDAKKYPQIKKPIAKSQSCSSCNFYTKVNDGWGKCSMITGGAVSASGWCGSWAKKA